MAQSIQMTADLTNVTLAGQDDKAMTSANVTLARHDDKIEAHKVILGRTLMNYKTNPTNLLKTMMKNSNKNPMKIKVNQESQGYQFSAGAFSEVILPALQDMAPGTFDHCNDTTIEVISNTKRVDLVNTPDSNLIITKISTKDGEEAVSTTHVYFHNHSMLVQGTTLIAGVPVWKMHCDTYLTPLLEQIIVEKQNLIYEANDNIARKATNMLKCTKCSVSLKGEKGLHCTVCEKPFHINCTDAKHRKKALTEKDRRWVCVPCKATCLFTRLEESSLVPAGFLTAQFLQKT